MKIAIASDHAAVNERLQLVEHLAALGHEVKDFGPFSADSVDYARMAVPPCEAVAAGEYERGILLCGTGIGMSIIAGKVKGIRCAHCAEPVSARLSREHNDANVLALGGRTLGMLAIKEIADVWLNTPFSGDERHRRRIDQITSYEEGTRP